MDVYDGFGFGGLFLGGGFGSLKPPQDREWRKQRDVFTWLFSFQMISVAQTKPH